MQTSDDYFRSEEFLNKLEEYERAISEGAGIYMDINDLADIVDYYNSLKNYDGAMHAADVALSLFPGAAAPLLFKARRALDEGDLAGAKRLAKQIEDKSQFEYAYLTAEIAIAQNDMNKSEKILLSSYANETCDRDREDFSLDVAELYIDYGVYDLAGEWLARCKDKSSADFFELSGRRYYSIGNYDEARKNLNNLLDKNPYRYQAWNLLSTIQADKENYSEAVTSCEYSLAIMPENIEGLLCMVRGLIGLDNIERATEFALKAARTQVDEPNLYSRIMAMMIDAGYHRNAYDFFNYCKANIMPYGLWDGYSYMAIACCELDKMEEFEDNLRTAVINNPEEVKMAMGSILPAHLSEDEYFDYIVNYVKNKLK